MNAKYFVHVPICLLKESQAVEFLGMRWQYRDFWTGLGFRLTAIAPFKHPPIFVGGLTRVGVYCSKEDFSWYSSNISLPVKNSINHISDESFR